MAGSEAGGGTGVWEQGRGTRPWYMVLELGAEMLPRPHWTFPRLRTEQTPVRDCDWAQVIGGPHGCACAAILRWPRDGESWENVLAGPWKEEVIAEKVWRGKAGDTWPFCSPPLIPSHTPANMASHWIYSCLQIPCFDFHPNPKILIMCFQIL